MSEVVDKAVVVLRDKLDGGFDGLARIDIRDEGSVMVDPDGVREDKGEADVVMTASAETFQAILDGDMDATTAFMTGKLQVDGDMGQAMKLGSALS